MNRGRVQGGYTVVELLIFLAVSAAIFVSTMAVIGGRQERTAFQQSVGNFESQIQDIANDVSTGYYSPNSSTGSNFTCTVNSANNFTFASSATDQQGKNAGCIFIGKAIRFGAVSSSQYRVMTLVGARTTVSGGQAVNSSSLSESYVRAVYDDLNSGNGNEIDASQLVTLDNRPQVACVWYNAAPSANPCSSPQAAARLIDVIAFLTTFVPVGAGGGANNVNVVVPVSPSSQTRTPESAAAAINTFGTASNVVTNPSSGVYACLNSGGGNQRAILKIGGTGSTLATRYSIGSGAC